jgi:putative ABC transport system permease protein
MLQRQHQVPIAFDNRDKTIVELSTGFRGYRLIAQSIDDVPILVKQFEDISVKVSAKLNAIVKLQRLDRSLNFLVLAVGLVALVGGVCVVAASFIASIKRKSLDYATFRLIGVSKSQVSRIPMIQAFIVAVVAYALSVIVYFIVSIGINRYIANLIDFNGQLSRLESIHFILSSLLVVIGAIGASILAAREATVIDPAIALGGSR